MANSVAFVITAAGQAALVNAAHDGTNKITINRVDFGTGQYAPSSSQTDLKERVATATSVSGTNAGDNVIHVVAQDSGTQAYAVHEIGIYATVDGSSDQILFAVYSDASGNPILEKTTQSIACLAFDLLIASAGVSNIEFGDTSFLMPPATTSTAGVARLATSADLAAGTDGTKIVTPSVMNSYLKAQLIAALPTGIIIPFAGTSTVPNNFLLCNGALVSRVTYSALYAAIGTAYGAGDGSTTFALPDYRDRVLQGASASHAAGTYIAAGLPNIIGTVRDMYGSSGRYVSDAFKQTEIGVANGLASGNAFSLGSTNIVMYASDSNSLYGSSSTVQPAAGAIQYLIKY